MQFRTALMASVSVGIVSLLAIAPGVQAGPMTSNPTDRNETPFCTAEALVEGACMAQGYLRPHDWKEWIPCSIDAEAVDSAAPPVACSVPLPSCQAIPVDTLDPYVCIDPSQVTVEGLLASAGGAAEGLVPPEEEDEAESEDAAEDESESEEPITDEAEEILSDAATEPLLPDAGRAVDDLLSAVSIQSPLEVKSADVDVSKTETRAFDPAPALGPETAAETPPGPPASAPNHLWTLLLLLVVALAVGLHQWRMFSPLLG
jgi:hypothetical protein